MASDDRTLSQAITAAIQELKTGKALSNDLIPDDFLDKENLKEQALRHRQVIFNGPILRTNLNARAVLLSKNGTHICTPDQTRMIVIQPLLMRIIDKVTLKIIEPSLRKYIGGY